MPLTQSEEDIFSQQSHMPTLEQPLRGVRQDNPAPPRYSTASPQPASVSTDMLSQATTPPNNKIPRSQKRPKRRRKTNPRTFWLQPGVDAELVRVAHARQLSVSKTGASLLEGALQQDLETQQGALFEAVISKLMRERERVFNNRFAALLVRFAVEMGQVRHLVTNLLPILPDMTEEKAYHLLEESHARSKRNLSRRFPELERDIEKLSQWLTEGKEEESDGT